MKLNERAVAEIEPPAEGYILEYDNNHAKAVPGFGVRVTANGAKAFIFQYRFKGRSVRITIGKLGKWTVLAARRRAQELGRLVDSGCDPMAERNAGRGAPLMAELLTRYLTEHALRKKKLSSVQEDWGLIHGGKFHFDAKAKKLGQPDKPFNGTLGHYFSKMQVAAVTRGDVSKFHGSLHETPYRANRALALLSKAMNLAELWELRPDNSNPCRHVEKYQEVARDRHLGDDDLAALDKALKQSDQMVAAAIRLLLFTGCRVSEVLGLTGDRVDLRTGVARLEDAKAGARDVLLSTPALAVLSKLSTEGPIFGDLTYSTLDKAWRRIREDAGLKGARLHDLRHTVGTMAGMGGANSFIVRDLLGHKTLAMTGRYVSKDTDPVRQTSERISSRIAAAFKGEKAEVVDHPKAGRR